MIETIVPLLVVIAGGATTIATTRLGRKGDRENALIDQYQEDRKEDRQRMDGLVSRIEVLERKVIAMTARDAQWEIHATRVEAQVVDLGGTPHERPASLTVGEAIHG